MTDEHAHHRGGRHLHSAAHNMSTAASSDKVAKVGDPVCGMMVDSMAAGK